MALTVLGPCKCVGDMAGISRIITLLKSLSEQEQNCLRDVISEIQNRGREVFLQAIENISYFEDCERFLIYVEVSDSRVAILSIERI